VFVADGERRELRPGESVTVPEGVLVYEGLTAWMGYKVFYDPTLPWLLASATLAIAALAAFFWRRFGRAQGVA
jgi:cytochrome c biogenesis protein ResB